MKSINLKGIAIMSMTRFRVMPLVLAAAVLWLAWNDECSPQQPKGGKKTPDPLEAQKKLAAELLKRQEIQALKSAYVLLATANTNYAGHKGKAMGEVEAALNILDANSVKQTKQQIKAIQDVNKLVSTQLLGATQAANADVLQAISDAQVANAGRLLNQLANVMAANNQPKLLKHVQKAVEEINASPKRDPLKNHEVAVLTSAFILLATANHDYDGHRVKAMRKVDAALESLAPNALKNESVRQNIKLLKEANAKRIAQITNMEDPIITEPQSISDAQLLIASAMIQQATLYMNNPKQRKVLNELRDACKEISNALTVR